MRLWYKRGNCLEKHSKINVNYTHSDNFFATQTEMSTFFAKKLEKFEKQARTKIKEIKKEDYK